MAPTVGRGHKGPDVHAVHEEQEEGDVFGRRSRRFHLPRGDEPIEGELVLCLLSLPGVRRVRSSLVLSVFLFRKPGSRGAGSGGEPGAAVAACPVRTTLHLLKERQGDPAGGTFLDQGLQDGTDLRRPAR